MRSLVLALALALIGAPGWAASRAAEPLEVIVDHDGGVDDLIALALLVRSGQVRVRAVTVCPADSFLEPATRATELFLDRAGARGITIAKGRSEGINPFPDAWREDAGRVLELDALKGVAPTGANPVVAEDAAHHLVSLLSGEKTYAIVETGPLTNIAEALRLDPTIKRRIGRIYVMGGAVRVGGNVEQPGHDGSAEWNLYNEPQAAAEVIAAGIPITLVPLDATNKAPLSRGFVERLAAAGSPLARLSAEAWRLVLPRDGPENYYFWDTLTAAVVLDPGLVRTETLTLKVLTAAPSAGRTVEAADGAPVETALDADRPRLEDLFVEILGR